MHDETESDVIISLLTEADVPPKAGFRPAFPLPVIVRTLEEEVWASAVEGHGQGSTEAEAKADLWLILEEDYQFLLKHKAKLGMNRLSRLAQLSKLLERK